jgi:hypothetical protein
MKQNRAPKIRAQTSSHIFTPTNLQSLLFAFPILGQTLAHTATSSAGIMDPEKGRMKAFGEGQQLMNPHPHKVRSSMGNTHPRRTDVLDPRGGGGRAGSEMGRTCPSGIHKSLGEYASQCWIQEGEEDGELIPGGLTHKAPLDALNHCVAPAAAKQQTAATMCR